MASEKGQEIIKNDSKTVLIAAGGTSGHIFPALAIAKELRSSCPSCRIVFCGVTDGLEHKTALQENFEFRHVTAQNLPSKNDPRYWSWLKRNVRGMRLSYKAMKELKPDIVIGTGGYVSAPVLTIAKLLRIPYVLHEQNSIPGRANRFFSKGAEKVFISYDVSRSYFSKKNNLYLTGNPVRPDFYRLDYASARESIGMDPGAFAVLVMGGSLGAKTINNAVRGLDQSGEWSMLIEQHPQLSIMVSTGTQNDESVAELLSTIPHVSATSFYHDAPLRIAACDFYVGRAGAMTCAEITALGKPAILIPYPFAADDHQTENANVMKRAGAAFVCDDRSFDSHTLLEVIKSAVVEKDLLAEMGAKAKSLATPYASRMIAKEIIDLLYRHGSPKR
ncbi:MAG TPA: undecaprenyldiphospho-muramoylpentapeptide beta-N-acetylglucosaminyltransferase [Bacillota bacterium]|jgi:UDP-N-acetylglucosamine--N-acetylmuramyl-(pentapeptide) pyrophosphoryl-undecaprenol N-acetylglucosamine transferase|nr:undecaprenyldiphospho-muramoylpentapeptide beta-N-acetylglucosaminyltransferase [Clostridia bacterium]NMA35510.1 undecaprenyldiphospho-muramoylpentapeptide beta-N-acetylglucosaminyltransferase [Clostridiaceae bacterium]HPY64374.1 undecaprenyldiphospho-muramoylpentapeptide beta-N-acetylglucosaminyltransferase [Bacillota bacterium]MBP6161467.1 undecaprenyldiphospho-muramoylpentapeptide beta-N-acetylglucosaminyltransferase [Clostridia bacterium]MBP6950102.1 undecaprenyldiphospho-muramoylpentape